MDFAADAKPQRFIERDRARIVGIAVEEGRLAAILADGTTAMPGNIAYLIGEDSANPDAIWIVELWSDKDAHAASLQLPAVQAAIKKGRPLIVGFGQRIEFKPVASARH